MEGNTDVNQLFETAPELWGRSPGRPRSTWLQEYNDIMVLLETRDAVENRSFRHKTSVYFNMAAKKLDW